MKIAVLDDYQNCVKTLNCYSLLDNFDVKIITDYHASESTLIPEIIDRDALVLTRTRTSISSDLLSQLPQLKVISQTGKNAGHIDEDACQQHGVVILESKGNPIATAELTWNLILSGLRQLPQAIQSMKEGKWQVNIGRRVYEKRIGIWGYGKIGQRIAAYGNAFGANLMIWGSEQSRSLAAKDGYDVAESKFEFFSTCDVISLHLRLKEETKHIVSLEDLKLMKPDSLLVNTARAALLEPGALIKALQSGRPGCAAIDVYDKEPIFNNEHPLLQMKNVICTPHLGYVEREGYELYFGQAFQNLLDFIDSSK